MKVFLFYSGGLGAPDKAGIYPEILQHWAVNRNTPDENGTKVQLHNTTMSRIAEMLQNISLSRMHI